MKQVDSMGNQWAQEIWDSEYENREFEFPRQGDQVRAWLEKWTAPEKPGSCLEIGCFPGRYLAVFGEKGYELNGVDLTPRTRPEMYRWLKGRGYKVGDIQKADFFKLDTSTQFDVVYSNGFLEHFSEWLKVLSRHADLVRPGGLLLVCVPNFKGRVQNFFHRIFDQENLARHFVPSMDPELWRPLLEGQGFRILYSGFFDRFDFWIGEQKRGVAQKLLFRAFRALIPVLRTVMPRNSPSSSPYCGIVARKLAPERVITD